MSYTRLLTRLFNTPLMVTQDKLDIITSEVGLKLLAGEALSNEVTTTEHANIPKGHAVVTVFDSLVAKNGGGSSGFTSYESIVNQTKNYISTGHKKIIFYFDTPGGEVSGLFGTAAFIQSLPSKYGVETIGITDGMMASAGYVLGSSVQKLYATETSIVGSIGVIMTLINTVKADEAKGHEYTILRSKDSKAKLNPHEPFDDKAIDSAVKMLGILDTTMNDTVTSYRASLSMETVVNLEGEVVLGAEALQLGLIDGIVDSFDSLLDMSTADTKLLSTNTGNVNMNLEEALAANIQLTADIVALKAQESLTVSKAQSDERTRVIGIIDAVDTFKLTVASAKKRIVAGTTVEDSVSMFEEIAESIQVNLDTTTDASTLTPDTTPDTNDFHGNLGKALKSLDDEPQLFAGVK